MANISLTAGIRSNLSSLQSTATLLTRTQERLGTGKKVNSAIDDPTAFFTAQSLTNRASDLSARLDGISKGVQTVKAADTAITGITSLLKQAKSKANDARALSTETSSNSDREALLSQFNDLMTQIDEMAQDATYDGINLLNQGDLTVEFGEKIGSSSLTLNGFNGSTNGTVITVAENTTSTDWNGSAGNTEIDDVISKIEASLQNLRTESKKMSSNLSVLTTRQDFTKSLVSVLTVGSDNLTNADMNEESANLLALNTQQSLGINSLSLASQQAQSVLQLLQ
jgi:flagellin-like hook-associated protein FlgL